MTRISRYATLASLPLFASACAASVPPPGVAFVQMCIRDSLIGIEVVLLGLWTALGGGDNVVGIFKRILHIGAWVWIVQSYPTLSKALVDSLVQAGLLAGGGSGDVSLLMDPSRLAGYGLDATAPLTQKLADLGMTDAVSYTHLDVYKRQTESSGGPRGRASGR